MTRRQVASLLGAAPLAAQVATPPTTEKTPPLGVPAPSSAMATPDAKLQKANEEIRQASARLAGLEVPMEVEPAFLFRP